MSSAYPRSSSPTREREKKSRLSRLLGGKREKTPEPTNDTAHDSAYGSSEPTSSEAVPTFIPENERHGGEMVPAEKNSEVANIDQHRNLAMKPSTGEVFDEDTGEVVTVVTTTTTTTTTTTSKAGKKHQDVHEDVQRDVQSGTGPPPHLLEMPAGPRTPEPGNYPPVVTSTSTNNQARPPVTATGGGRLAPEQPRIPAKSPMRRSGDFSHERHRDSYLTEPAPVSPIDMPFARQLSNTPPASPSGHNFSYPSRSATKTPEQPVRQHPSALGDLRAAAKGLHGVGETLRGTLNNTVDQRFPSRNPEKAALINARNEETLSKGRAEMDGIPTGWSRHQPAHESHEHQPVPGSFDTHPMEPEEPAPGMATEVSPPVEEKKGLRKLFKRKPVAEQ